MWYFHEKTCKSAMWLSILLTTADIINVTTVHHLLSHLDIFQKTPADILDVKKAHGKSFHEIFKVKAYLSYISNVLAKIIFKKQMKIKYRKEFVVVYKNMIFYFTISTKKNIN